MDLQLRSRNSCIYTYLYIYIYIVYTYRCKTNPNCWEQNVKHYRLHETWPKDGNVKGVAWICFGKSPSVGKEAAVCILNWKTIYINQGSKKSVCVCVCFRLPAYVRKKNRSSWNIQHISDYFCRSRNVDLFCLVLSLICSLSLFGGLQRGRLLALWPPPFNTSFPSLSLSPIRLKCSTAIQKIVLGKLQPKFRWPKAPQDPCCQGPPTLAIVAHFW